ncbi:MAG: hypothetical protein ACXWUX_03940 [Allosphingosinicella sp.]
MKKILIGAVASTVLATTFAAPAFAAPNDSVNFQVTASVAQECSLETPVTLAIGAIGIEEAPGANALLITTGGQSPIDGVWLSCNTPYRVSFSSLNGGLVSPSNAGNPSIGEDGFTDRMNYFLKMSTPRGEESRPTTGTPGEFYSGDGVRQPLHEEVGVFAAVRPGDNVGARPLAGTDYADTATITLTAQ